MKKNSLSVFLGMSLLFLLLILILCWYSRFATDDYFYSWSVQRYGMLDSFKKQYLGWCGRFSSLILLEILFGSFGTNHFYYAFFLLLSFSLITVGTYKNIHLFASYFSAEISKQEKGILSLSFTALLFFLSVDIGETWFWYCCPSFYVWSILAFIWGIYFVFSKQTGSMMFAGTIISFIYVGGASEVFTMVFGVILILLFIYRFIKSATFSDFMKEGVNKKIVIAILFLSLAFIVFLAAPGNYARNELFPKRQFFYSFFIAGKSIIKFFIYYLPIRLPYIFAFSAPFIFIGNHFKTIQDPKFNLPFYSFFKRISILFAALAFFFFYLVAFITVETGAPRVWFLISFLLSVYCCCIAFYGGYCLSMSENRFIILKRVSAYAGIAITVYCIVQQNNIASSYSKACDERIDYLQRLNNEPGITDSIVKLSPLPACGMLYSAEITADTNHFKNQHMRMAYHLKYYIIVKK